MTDPLVGPLTNTQVDQQVKKDENPSYLDKVATGLDIEGDQIAGGKVRQTMSSSIAEEDEKPKGGVKRFFSGIFGGFLNLITPGHKHLVEAEVSDDVKAIEAQKEIESNLNKVDGGKMVQEIRKDTQ